MNIAESERGSTLGGAVVLRHGLPDGSWHYDLLIERAGDPREHRLVSFRCGDGLLAWEGVFGVTRMGDHRAVYLRYEGDIGGGRGCVERVASGRVIEMGESDGAFGCVVDWGDRRVRMTATRGVGDRWVLVCGS